MTMLVQIVSVAAVLTSLPLCSCYNILAFYPYPASSHHRVYWPLLKELIARGHNVTMFSPLVMPQPPKHNYTHLKVKDYSDEIAQWEDTGIMNSSIGFLRFFRSSVCFMSIGQRLTERVAQEEVFQWLLRSDSEFDLIFGEWTFSHEAFVSLHHRFKAINAELTSYGNSHWTYWVYGQPFETSYIADTDTGYSDRMNFAERFQNTMHSWALRLVMYWYFLPKHQIVMDQHIRYPGWESRPAVLDLLRNTSLVLINTHYSLNYPFPNSPHVKEIGGINVQPLKPLPENIGKFMDEATDGVIYFSLGSFLQGSSVLDDQLRDVFLQVFRQLKQRVLWKWEQPISDLPDNVFISRWLPQQDILGHKNCKLFISHAGLLSLTETVRAAVPVVAIPLWADQMKNSRQMTTKGYALQLDFANLTYHSISWAINHVISNPVYREKVREQSKIFLDKPETALETAVYWTEYVIRHKGAHHLRPAIATMPWYQQAMIDVYLVMTLIVVIPIYILYRIIRSCIHYCKSLKIKND